MPRECAMEKENDILLPEIQRLLETGHQVQFTPRGVSMRPYIEGGQDSVLLEYPTRPLRAGDIVLAKCGRTYLLHRIISCSGEQIILRGDGNLYGTESCSRQDVLGIVTMVLRNGTRPVSPTRAALWRHLPYAARKYGLKIYNKCRKWHFFGI